MVMRITGLSSGMDIESIVTDLMKAENIPLDKIKAKKQTLTWKSDGYREVNKQLASLRDTLTNLRFSSSWKTTKASSSDESIAKVTGNSTSVSSHTLKVSTLATTATASGATASTAGAITSSLTDPDSYPVTITSGTNDKLNVTLNGVTKTITLTAKAGGYATADELAAEVQTQLNKSFGYNAITATATGGTLKLTPQGTIDSATGKDYSPQLTVGANGSNSGLAALGFTEGQSYKINVNAKLSDVANFGTALTFSDPDDKSGKFTINGVDISYTSEDTISSIMTRVNSSSAGVKMSYDSITDQFTITSKTTGAASAVDVKDKSGGNFIAAIGFGAAGTSVNGTDANVEIDGVPSMRSSNSFTVDGLTYNLVSADPNKKVTLNVNQDSDTILSTIKSFVTAYNDTLALVNKKLNETKDSDYQPLTDDQKTDMSDDEIKLWEDKAKSGVLRSDSILRSITSSMRSLVTQSVSSVSSDYNALYKIGITTQSISSGSYDSTNAGKLVIDEDKLKAAIDKDPESVIKLFSAQTLDNDSSKMGIAQQLYNKANDSITELIKKAGGLSTTQDSVASTIGKQIHDLGNDIDEFEAKLTSKEDFYYKQFSAMETAIQKGNSTLSWLTSQLG